MNKESKISDRINRRSAFVLAIVAVFVLVGLTAGTAVAQQDGTGPLTFERNANVDIAGTLNGFAFTPNGEYAVDNSGTAYELTEDSPDNWSTSMTFSIVDNAEGLTYSDASSHFFVTNTSGYVTEYDSNWNKVDSHFIVSDQVDGIDYSPKYQRFMVKQHGPDDVFLFDTDWNQVDNVSEQTSDSVAGIFYESVYAFEYSLSNDHAEWDSDLNFLADRTNSGPSQLRGADINGYDTGEVYLISQDGNGEVYSFNNSVSFDIPVRITGTNSPVTEGDVLEVTANVTNLENTTRTLSVNLTDTDFSNQQQDQTSVTLNPNESTTVVLEWQTNSGDAGTGEVTVATEDGTDSQIVTVEEREESDGCIDRRSLSRGEENQECPRDRTLSRGGSRDDLDRGATRGGERARRDRGRGR